ncbi:MAG: BA14K family protein [Zhengella sp.]
MANVEDGMKKLTRFLIPGLSGLALAAAALLVAPAQAATPGGTAAAALPASADTNIAPSRNTAEKAVQLAQQRRRPPRRWQRQQSRRWQRPPRRWQRRPPPRRWRRPPPPVWMAPPPPRRAYRRRAPAYCNFRACARAYRSFRASDCTYQPYGGGPRRYCTK